MFWLFILPDCLSYGCWVYSEHCWSHLSFSDPSRALDTLSVYTGSAGVGQTVMCTPLFFVLKPLCSWFVISGKIQKKEEKTDRHFHACRMLNNLKNWIIRERLNWRNKKTTYKTLGVTLGFFFFWFLGLRCRFDVHLH